MQNTDRVSYFRQKMSLVWHACLRKNNNPEETFWKSFFSFHFYFNRLAHTLCKAYYATEVHVFIIANNKHWHVTLGPIPVIRRYISCRECPTNTDQSAGQKLWHDLETNSSFDMRPTQIAGCAFTQVKYCQLIWHGMMKSPSPSKIYGIYLL